MQTHRSPLLTVAVPVSTQSRAHLAAAIASVIRQDTDRWKLVVIDDAVGESTYEELVSSFGDERITYVRNRGEHGIGAAWNACIEAATTDLFSILHADDELLPHYVRSMHDLALHRPDGAMYFCGASIIDDDGNPMWSFADAVKRVIQPGGRDVCLVGERAISRLMIGDFIMCPTVVYRRSAIGGRRFSTAHRFVLDIDFIVGALFDGARIYGTRNEGYRYRRHPAAATAVFDRSGYRFAEETEFHRMVERRAVENGFHRAAFAARVMFCVRGNIVVSMAKDVLAGRLRAARAKSRMLRSARGFPV
ncbi:MAG: glycosyl transferase [Candidatus Eremiobacteraeota bacterium]|nr:glycosyl transferase [Candidatus Eremiobacteraeota bacterium]